jgi:hypothetical protein
MTMTPELREELSDEAQKLYLKNPKDFKLNVNMYDKTKQDRFA